MEVRVYDLLLFDWKIIGLEEGPYSRPYSLQTASFNELSKQLHMSHSYPGCFAFHIGLKTVFQGKEKFMIMLTKD